MITRYFFDPASPVTAVLHLALMGILRPSTKTLGLKEPDTLEGDQIDVSYR